MANPVGVAGMSPVSPLLAKLGLYYGIPLGSNNVTGIKLAEIKRVSDTYVLHGSMARKK
jgi:hypothetical protein